MKQIIEHYTSATTYKRLVRELLFITGAITLLLEALSYSFQLTPISTYFGGFWGIIAVSLIGSIWSTKPKFSFSAYDRISNSKITVKIGDLLNEDGNLAFGINDCLDTSLGKFISQNSVQGQLTTKFYSGDCDAFFDALKKSATKLGIKSIKDATKKNGKCWRYPIGTVLVINQGSRQVFPTIYATMKDNGMAESTMNEIWVTIAKLWDRVREYGNKSALSLPVFGTNFGRVRGGITFNSMVKLIVTSYILFARTQPITNELRLVIHKNDADKIDMVELEDFVKNLM